MASDVTPIERIEDRPIGVDPAAIEEEFARVWQEMSGSGYDESSVRLRVLNFVAIGRHDDDANRFEQVMQVVPRLHPGRGILALMTEGRGAVEAAISAHCFREPSGSLDVCSEEVLLSGGRAYQRELASAVLALLVPEIPVTVWVIGGDDLTSYVVSEVLEASDALMSDSGGAEAVGAALRAQLRAQESHDVRFYDLAWGRTETWRELAAQFFDGEDRAAQIGKIKSIEIRGYRGRASSEPMLVAGWLVSRLGYSLADLDGDDETLRATLYDGSRGVTLSIGSGWAPDLMNQLRITTSDAVFELEAHEVSHHLHVEERWGIDEYRRTVEQPSLDDASLVRLGFDTAADPRIGIEAATAALALLGE